MKEDMRDMFAIIKGQYRKGVGDSFNNSANNTTMYLGGYDPYSPDTVEWYQLLDTRTLRCISCGGDYNKVLKGVYNTIKRYKGDLKLYTKKTSHTPNRAPSMRCLCEHVVKEYGVFFRDDIEDMEDLAYRDLRDNKPLNKARKLVAKNKKSVVENDLNTRNGIVLNTLTPKKLVKTKPKMGVKKLPMM